MITDAEHAKIMSLKSRLPVSVGCLPFHCRLPPVLMNMAWRNESAPCARALLS